MNALQKILSILMILLLCALALADIGERVFGSTAAPQGQITTSGACQQLLTNGDLESSGGWQFGSTPARASVVNSPVHGGAGAIRLGLVDSAANVVAHSSAYQAVALPAGAPQLLLTFWERPSGGDGSDYREVLLLRTNFSTLRTLSKQTATGNGQWGERTFDLTDLAGQTVYLYFNVYNNGAGSRTVNYVDDIVLANCSEPPPETVTPVPTATVVSSATPTPTPPAGEPTVTPQSTATPVTNAVVLRAGSVDAGDAGEAAIPLDLVSLPNGQNVGALSVDLLYDAARLGVAECSDGGVYDLLLCNTDEPGRVQLAALAASGVAAPGLLAMLHFVINGADQSTIPLELRTDSLINAEGADLAVSTQNGRITFNCNPNEKTCGNSGSPDNPRVYLPIMAR